MLTAIYWFLYDVVMYVGPAIHNLFIFWLNWF